MKVHDPGGAVHVAAALLHQTAPAFAFRDGVKAGVASLPAVVVGNAYRMCHVFSLGKMPSMPPGWQPISGSVPEARPAGAVDVHEDLIPEAFHCVSRTAYLNFVSLG